VTGGERAHTRDTVYLARSGFSTRKSATSQLNFEVVVKGFAITLIQIAGVVAASMSARIDMRVVGVEGGGLLWRLRHILACGREVPACRDGVAVAARADFPRIIVFLI
jgi:hypothetical protein